MAAKSKGAEPAPEPAHPKDKAGKFTGWPKGTPMPKVKCRKCGQEFTKGKKKWHDKKCKGSLAKDVPLTPPEGVAPAPYRFVLEPEPVPAPEGEEDKEGGEPGAAEEGPRDGQGPEGQPPGLPVSMLAQASDPVPFWGGIADAVNDAIDHEENKIQMTEERAKGLHTAAIACLPQFFLNPFFIFGSMLFLTFAVPVIRDKRQSARERREAEEAAKKAKLDEFSSTGQARGDAGPAPKAAPA